MKRSCKELKRIARENLTGNYGIPMGAFAITSIILTIVQLPFSIQPAESLFSSRNILCLIAQFLIALVNVLFACGMLKIHLKMARKQKYSIPQLFYFFQHYPDRILLSGLLMAIIILIASIPMFAGCVLAYYSTTGPNILIAVIFSLFSLFWMVTFRLRLGFLYFVLIEHEEMSVPDAFQISSKLIKGHMGRLLYMEFSFVGMYVLALLSFGIGFFWIEPYQMQTLVNFYLDVIGELPGSPAPMQTFSQAPPPNFDWYV